MDVLSRIDPALCVPCKAARGLCGIDPCPLLARIRHHLPKQPVVGKDLWGSSPPSLFIGRHGYPNVHLGPMLPPQHLEDDAAHRLDAPRDWIGLTIPDVVGMRSGLVRTTHRVRVGDALRGDRITRLTQELALAARPVDTEVHLSRAPRFGMPTVAEFTAPHGPSVPVERASLGENVRIERPLEAATSDTDLRAADAVTRLYQAGTDAYQLEKVLSAGLLGIGRHRRFVPTRWAITATDDTIGKALIPPLLDRPTIAKPLVHEAERFGNRFLVLLLPRVWSFELVEAWMKGSFWTRAGSRPDPIVASDHEDHTGRTTYAQTAGGYYATRLPVLEHLHAIGRQATAVVLREIDDRYTTPLGVWVVRETCRAALATRPLVFETEEAAIRHMDRRARLDWRVHAPHLKTLRQQRSLDSF